MTDPMIFSVRPIFKTGSSSYVSWAITGREALVLHPGWLTPITWPGHEGPADIPEPVRDYTALVRRRLREPQCSLGWPLDDCPVSGRGRYFA